MKRNFLKIACTVLIALVSQRALTQDFLVTPTGDTLKGEIKPLFYNADKRVQLTEPGKKKVIYPFFKVKSFSLDGEIYQPVKGPTGYTFMKLLKPGYLSLYAFQPDNQNIYSGTFLLKKDGEGMEVPNLTFKKGMRRFLEDCPVVANKIDQDLLNKRDIDQIIDEYNACIESGVTNPEPVTTKPAPVVVKTSNAWLELENKVKSHSDFAEKANALDMINEIKAKLAASQKVPNFLIEGLKSALPQEELQPELETALKEIN